MERDKKGIGDILSTLTVAILFAAIMILVVFCASSYRRSTEMQRSNENCRAVLSYVVTAVRDHGGGRVEPGEFSGYKGLSIDAGNGYEQRLYVKDGQLLEEFVQTGFEADPETATVIGETGTFEAGYTEGGLLRIRTDQGTVYVDAESRVSSE